MFCVALLIAGLAFANGAAVLPEVKIVGGTLAVITEAPWQVALLNDFNGSGIYYQVCGGVIISRTAILSSAQCVYDSFASRLRIRAGSSFHNSGGEVIQVSAYKIHELFSLRYLQNDLAILFLTNPITLGTSAATATLPAQGLTVVDNAACFVTGWGMLSAGGETPTQLHKMTVSSVNQMQCVSALSSFNAVTTNMLCAGRIGIGGMDACTGDTGGPLMVSNILIGISSWGRGCGEPQYPGVYTRVPMYRTWINNNL